MSYTHQKVLWEKTLEYPIDKDTEIYLLDSNENPLLDYNGEVLITSVSKLYDEYGDTIMDIYGDITYPNSQLITARKQPHEEVFKDDSGLELLSKSYFYVDPLIEPNALKIAKMDKLDGETVRKIYVMCDLMGKPKMLRFITV